MSTKEQLIELLDENNKIIKSYVKVLNNIANIINSEKETKSIENTTKKESKNSNQADENCEKLVLTLQDVRKVLVEKSREGYSEDIRALLVKYGAEKLSEINPTNYQILMDEAASFGATIEIIKAELKKKQEFSDQFKALYEYHFATSLADLKKEYYSSFLRDLRSLGNE